MPKVEYIGTTAKTDSIDGIGLHWEPGQARDVTGQVAERLLVYSDTWRSAQEKAGFNPEAVDLTPPSKEAEEPLPAVDFHAMDKKAMIDYAERHYGEQLNKRMSEENIRHKLIALFTHHEMEQG